MVDVINVDGDVANYNASKLHTTAGELPGQQAVAEVEGNRAEPAASYFTQKLREQTGKLSSQIEGLRSFIATNADALTHAVNTLRETDRMTADAAGKATALIDDVLATPTPGPSTGAASGATAAAATSRAFNGR